MSLASPPPGAPSDRSPSLWIPAPAVPVLISLPDFRPSFRLRPGPAEVGTRIPHSHVDVPRRPSFRQVLDDHRGMPRQSIPAHLRSTRLVTSTSPAPAPIIPQWPSLSSFSASSSPLRLDRPQSLPYFSPSASGRPADRPSILPAGHPAKPLRRLPVLRHA
jgi:hypothetical protein